LGEVKEKIYAYVGGKEKCEWSDAQIEGEVYFDRFSEFNVTGIICVSDTISYFQGSFFES